MNEMVPVEGGAPARRSPLMAGGRPQAIVPQSMEDAYRLATAICQAQMAPRGLDTPEKCMVAIMHGLEVGLTPMAALQRIAVVNGRPTIWGDGAVGLVRGSGLCEYINEHVDGAGDAMVATCEAKRRHEPDAVVRTFSVADAKKAGLWGKSGPWQQFPTRMLAMRARAFCLRDLFADVLGGLYLKEEVDNDGATERQEGPRRVAPPSAAPAIEHRPELEPAQTPQTPAEPRRAPSATQQPAKAEPVLAGAPYDPEKLRKRFIEAANKAKDRDELNDAWNNVVDPVVDELMPPDRDDLDRIYSLRAAEVDGEEGAQP